MTINRSRNWWTGTEAADIDDYLAAYSAAAEYPTGRVIHIKCGDCRADTFTVRVDDEEGCAERTCTSCGAASLIFDSRDTLDQSELEGAACPCGGEVFNAAAGFALREDGDIQWVYLGLRCTRDGVLGCYTDWRIDYSPTVHLFEHI